MTNRGYNLGDYFNIFNIFTIIGGAIFGGLVVIFVFNGVLQPNSISELSKYRALIYRALILSAIGLLVFGYILYKKNKHDENKALKDILNKLDYELIQLQKKTFSEGRDVMYDIQSRLIMIIRRVYPKHKEVEEELLGDCYFYWDVGDTTQEYRQKTYEDDVKKYRRVVNNILSENQLFGLKEFEPIKKETEIQVGSDRVGYIRKKTNK